jgi:molecular chaperone DnaK
MTRSKAVGIDLGTTNSAIAWVDDMGRSLMVPNSEGDELTPSFVLFRDDGVVVGRDAQLAASSVPERVAQCVKRDMGAAVYRRPIRGEYLPPQVIQACLLRKLKADMAERLGDDCRVAVTVPAYFDEPRRKATADAGELAELSFIDIVNEPTAAALSFGEICGYLGPSATGADTAALEEMNVLVYDLGGGTFDVTLLHFAPGAISTLATDGDVQLGGHDWDQRLVDYLAEEFEKLYKLDPREVLVSQGRLFEAAVAAKHALTIRDRTTVRVEHAGHQHDFTVSRELFEELTADLLERTSYTSRQVLSAAKLQWQDVSRVLLVGGSTRMPMVTRMIRDLTSLEPDHSVNPDEAVARGAAIYARYLLDKQSPRPQDAPKFEITNVNAHSLGVEGIDQQTLRNDNIKLIPRNTPLPARFTKAFVTRGDNQKSIAVRILEGESSRPAECAQIGKAVIRDLPQGLAKGHPVEVTFEYGSNGCLKVDATVPGTSGRVSLEFEREGGLSTKGLAGWKQPISQGAGFDAFEEMIADTLSETGPAATQTPPATPQPAPATASGSTKTRLPEEHTESKRAPKPSLPSKPLLEMAARQIPSKKTKRRNSTPNNSWILMLVFYITSVVAGLGAGYLFLSLFWDSDRFPLPW